MNYSLIKTLNAPWTKALWAIVLAKTLPTICQERLDAFLHDKIWKLESHDTFFIAYLSSPFLRHPEHILVCIHIGILPVR